MGKRVYRVMLVLFIILAAIIFTFPKQAHSSQNDQDDDGMPDEWENLYGLNNASPDDAGFDKDGDTLNNSYEFKKGTSPNVTDTDYDGYSDLEEVTYNWTFAANASKYPPHSLNHVLLAEPSYGFSKIDKFNLKIKTSNESSECKFTANPAIKFSNIQASGNIFSKIDERNFEIKDFDLSNTPDGVIKKFYVICKTLGGYINDEFPEQINLSVDKTMPILESVSANPDFLTERLETVLVAKTDDDTVCKFDEANISYIYMKYSFANEYSLAFSNLNSIMLNTYSVPSLIDETNYTFYVACMNKVSYYSNSKKVNFLVNLSTRNAITYTSPSGYISSDKATLVIKTNKDSTCYFGEKLDNTIPPDNSKFHSIIVQNLTEGAKSFNIICDFDLGSGSVNEIISFTVDKTKPDDVNFTMPLELCPGNNASVKLAASDKLGILGYYFKVSESDNDLINLTYIPKAANYFNLSNLTEGKTYYVDAFAVDLALNNGSMTRSKGLTILSEDDDKCIKNKPPELSFDYSLTEAGVKLEMECSDPDSKLGNNCQNTSYFLITKDTKDECSACGKCYSKYSSALTIKDNSTLCTFISDEKNLSVASEYKIQFESCNADEKICCNNKSASFCLDDNCTKIEVSSCDLSSLDTDNDRLNDLKEIMCGLDPYNSSDAKADDDNDGLNNGDECNYGTNITNPDSDGDGYADKAEKIEMGSDPLNKNDPGEETTTTTEEETEEETAPPDEEVPAVEQKSNFTSIIFFFIGIISIAGGLVVFITDKKEVNLAPSVAPEKIVDFRQAELDIKRDKMPSFASEPIQQVSSPQAQKQPMMESELDNAIRRKREALKMHRMTNVFDAFGEEKKEIVPTQYSQAEKSSTVYERLDALSKKDAFEELEVVSRKEGKGLKTKEKDIDNLIKDR